MFPTFINIFRYIIFIEIPNLITLPTFPYKLCSRDLDIPLEFECVSLGLFFLLSSGQPPIKKETLLELYMDFHHNYSNRRDSTTSSRPQLTYPMNLANKITT
jgi:hypothetical protein